MKTFLADLLQFINSYKVILIPTCIILYILLCNLDSAMSSIFILALFILSISILSLKKALYFGMSCTILIPTGMAGNILFKTHLFGIPFHPTDIIILIILTVYMKEIFVKHISFVFNSILLSLLALMIFITIYALYSKIFLQIPAWNIFRDLRGLYTFSVFFPLMSMAHSEHEKKNILHFLGWNYFLFSALMIVLFFFDSQLHLKQIQAEILNNSERLYFHNHSLSLLVIPTISLLWNRHPRLLYLFYLVSGIALILAHARMLLFLNTITICIVIALIYKYRSQRSPHLSPNPIFQLLRAGSGAFLTILIMGLFLRFTFTEFFHEKFVKFQQRITVTTSDIQEDSSFKGRWLVTVSSVKQILKKPLLGYGIGSQIPVPWAKQSNNEYLKNDGVLPSVDNTYVTIAYKMGFIGLSFLLIVILIIVKNILVFFRTAQPLYSYSIFIGFIMLVVDNLFQTVFINYRITWIILLYISLIVPLKQNILPNHSRNQDIIISS